MMNLSFSYGFRTLGASYSLISKDSQLAANLTKDLALDLLSYTSATRI